MNLTPGLVQSAFELLGLIGRQHLTIEAVTSGLRRIAGMPAPDALRLAQGLNWIEVDGVGLLQTTAAGGRLLDLDAYPAILRATLLDHAAILSPPWLQAARDGRARVLAFAPVGIKQILAEADVAEGTETDVVTFWDRLASLAYGRREDRLTAIGRTGERLSIEYETQRTGRVPRWVAIESNADGFDLLSIVSADDPRPMSIEVKTSIRGLSASLILTRNEWDTALITPHYMLHLWDAPMKGKARLACLTIDEARLHVPTDNGSGCWSEVEIPFASFEASFGDG